MCGVVSVTMLRQVVVVSPTVVVVVVDAGTARVVGGG